MAGRVDYGRVRTSYGAREGEERLRAHPRPSVALGMEKKSTANTLTKL